MTKDFIIQKQIEVEFWVSFPASQKMMLPVLQSQSVSF